MTLSLTAESCEAIFTVLTSPSCGGSAHVPPIVLLVDDDRDTREMYSAFFESSGMWVATAADPDEGMDAVEQLDPVVVVTDIGFGGTSSGVRFVHTLKEQQHTHEIPIVVLTGREADQIPAQMRHEADLVLVKPVLPDVLATRVGELLARAKLARIRSQHLWHKSQRLTERAGAIVSHAKRLGPPLATAADDTTTPGNRPCPTCSKTLEWLERGTIGGCEYDYYRWCATGCGLFCYDRRADNWVKLA